MIKRVKKWIQSVVGLKEKTTGALHRQLGIPEDQTIPVELLHEAADHPERFEKTKEAATLLGRRARFALVLRKFKKRR